MRRIHGVITTFVCGLVLAGHSASAQTHPGIFINAGEGRAITASRGKYPLLDSALAEAKHVVDAAIAKPIDVPQPGEAGGYAHERHKQNYREMQLAGTLFTITRDARYARFVRDMLEKYAVLYPTLGAHPLAKNQAPGKLFHQSLNEANWLVATAIAYDCIYSWLTPVERARFERNIFRPMADWLSVQQAREFDRIHNHGTWAVASVGMIGYVMRDTSYVNRALYGTKRNRTGGFLQQLDQLFSPDGYYMEGPYYARYALMPFYLFAEAIERSQPALGIYRYRDGILRKALYSAAETTFPNGVFPAINDASRTMAIDAPEMVTALDLAVFRYGVDDNLLGAARLQNDVLLNAAGLSVAKAIASRKTPPAMTWKSVEFRDGPNGERGGLGILRSGRDTGATMLLMKYGVHGEGHGHFDQLNLLGFDGGREVLPDYGFSRWINIEPKFGGRYLPENDSYAMQTVAHNTVVVDEKSQNLAESDSADRVWGIRNFFDAGNPAVQVMSALSDKAYRGVSMQRAVFLIDDVRLDHPVTIDLYKVESASAHTYDYVLHHRGQIIATNVAYRADSAEQVPLGKDFGYQHIWREAAGKSDSTIRVTLLDGNRYYSITSAANPNTEIIFGRTGANDPNFDLLHEPLIIQRANDRERLFASVIEPHGFFSEAQERSDEARGRIHDVRILADGPGGSVILVTGVNGLNWTVSVANAGRNAGRHVVQGSGRTFEWSGPFHVDGVVRRK